MTKKVQFIMNFGSHVKGTVTDLPEQVADNMVRSGAAVIPTAEPEISKTAPYKAKAAKIINKAL